MLGWTGFCHVPHRKPFSIIRDKEFLSANEALDATVKDHARKGLISSTKHKRPFSQEDLEALYSNNQLGLENPESLVNTAWFYIVLYFGKRGRENQREMKASDQQLKTTTGGLKYFVLKERATKNHPGGISYNENETQSVMMAWPGQPRRPVACLEKYITQRKPRCDAIWQKPRNHNAASFCQDDDIRFCGVPMGKHKIDNLLEEMCRKAGLATIYTAQCIRATSVTVLKAAGLENNRAKSVTSDKFIESCNTRPSTEQQFESSAIVSRFIMKQDQSNSVLPAVPPPSEPFLTSIQQQNQLHS